MSPPQKGPKKKKKKILEQFYVRSDIKKMNDGLTKIPLFKITNKMSNLLDLFRKKAIAIHSDKCFTFAKTNGKKV